MDIHASFDEIQRTRKELVAKDIAHWLHYNVVSWQWWALLGASIAPWIIWWVFVDKRRLTEILCFGFCIGIASFFLDSIGTNSLLWGYPVRLIPILPSLSPVDITCIPVAYMLIYQWCSTFGKFLCADIAVSAVCTYVLEPCAISFGVYERYTWRPEFSFVGYALLGLGARIFVTWSKRREIEN